MTTRTLKQTQPTLSARPRRHCEACQRPLPRRAYRRKCATCLKYDCGGYQVVTDIRHGQRIIRCWAFDRQLTGGDAA